MDDDSEYEFDNQFVFYQFSCGRRGFFVNSIEGELPCILLITQTFLSLVHPCGEEDDEEVAGFTNEVGDIECLLLLSQTVVLKYWARNYYLSRVA